MKAENLTFHNFDFIVDIRQATGMNGILTMVDDAIGIPHEHSCKNNDCRDSTLHSHQTPFLKCILKGLGIRRNARVSADCPSRVHFL